jgi:diguanylate cyclase (GGDEF)-like protein/PAS domain S-box-containing protein
MTLNPATILVVEDNPPDLEMFSGWIKARGHDPVLARSGEQGLDLLKTLDVDLILLDVSLPDMDARQFVASLKADKYFNTIPVMVVSAPENMDKVIQCILAGAVDYLCKPLQEVLLDARISVAISAIQERKTAERKLEESEERYRIISEVIPDIPYTLAITEDGKIHFDWVTDAYSRFLGNPPDMLKTLTCPVPQTPLEKYIIPEDIPVSRQHITRLLSGLSDVSEYRLIDGSGNLRWLRDYARPNVDPHSRKVSGIIGAVQDVTVRKQAEEALITSEKNLNLIFDLAPIGMSITDMEGKYLRVNQALCQTLGYTIDELVAINYEDISYQADIPHNREMRRKVIQGEIPGFQMEKRFFSKSGQLIYTLLQASLVRDQNGVPQHFISQLVDITERKKTDEELRRTNNELTSRVGELQLRNKEISLLNEMGNLLQSCQTREDAYAVIAQSAESMFDHQAGGLFVLSESRKLLEMVASWGGYVTLETVFDAKMCWALRRGQLHAVPGGKNRMLCAHHSPVPENERAASYLCVPLIAQGEAFGVMSLKIFKADEKGFLFGEEHRKQLALSVAERAVLALANIKLREILHIQSIRDVLTNLYNRRYMEETLDRELRRSIRRGTKLGVIMLDIDKFKSFNDTYGHDAGDALLKELGAFLQLNIRGEDVACRYGGEEIVVILPEINEEDALERAEELRLGVKEIRINYRGQLLRPLTISSGVSMYPDHGELTDDLLRAADTALYQAKRSGRDKVVLAEK